MNTEPCYVLNGLLAILYPDAGSTPCAECVRRLGETPRGDRAGLRALCCSRCAALDPSDRSFAILPHEIDALKAKGVDVDASLRACAGKTKRERPRPARPLSLELRSTRDPARSDSFTSSLWRAPCRRRRS